MENPRGDRIITLDGPIEKGDANLFRAIIQQAITAPGIDRLIISLDSPGGDVHEAIEIGKIVRASLAETWTASTRVLPPGVEVEDVPIILEGNKVAPSRIGEPLPVLSKCWSACTIIFFSGVQRAVFDNVVYRTENDRNTYPTIGVHRPSLSSEQYGELSAGEAQEVYNQMLQNMSDALRGFGAPEEFIRRTMATPSTEIDLIPSDEMERFALRTEPFFWDWLAARCGRDTDVLTDQREQELYRRYQKVWAERMDFDTSAEYWAWDEDVALVEEFGLIDAAAAYKISEKVQSWSRWVDLCQEITVRTARHEWAVGVR